MPELEVQISDLFSEIPDFRILGVLHGLDSNTLVLQLLLKLVDFFVVLLLQLFNLRFEASDDFCFMLVLVSVLLSRLHHFCLQEVDILHCLLVFLLYDAFLSFDLLKLHYSLITRRNHNLGIRQIG